MNFEPARPLIRNGPSGGRFGMEGLGCRTRLRRNAGVVALVELGPAFRGTTVDSPGWVALGGWLGGCPQPCNDYSFATWKGLFTLSGRVGLLSGELLVGAGRLDLCKTLGESLV